MNRIFVLFFLVLLASCNSKTEQVTPAPQELLKKLESLNDSLEQNQQIDKLAFWQAQLKHKDFSQSNPSLAYIHYHLAKNLAKVNADSAKHHINIALDIIEQEKEYNDLKFTIFNGAGMIAESEGKFYQSVYYFNKSTSIIMSDPLLQSKPVAKVICLLNAAQENKKIRQYQKAIEQNKLALTFLKGLPADYNKFRFRALSQLLTANVESKNYHTDSFLLYLKELKSISRNTNDPFQLRFTNEHTADYYTITKQYDSAIFYYKLVKDYDRQRLLADPQKISAA